MSQTHSGSFNSVNTTTSFGLEGHSVYRSNSLDSITHKLSNGTQTPPKTRDSAHRRKESGKTYDALEETSSVATSYSACDGLTETCRTHSNDAACNIPAKCGEASSELLESDSQSRHDTVIGNLRLQSDKKPSKNFPVKVDPEMIGFPDSVNADDTPHAVSN